MNDIKRHTCFTLIKLGTNRFYKEVTKILNGEAIYETRNKNILDFRTRGSDE